jgi:hypothetical protein
VRTPDPAWQQALDRIAPPHPNKSRLLVRWHGGRAYFDEDVGRVVWQPIERWIIWELLPTALMSPRFPAVVRMHASVAEGGVTLDRLQGVTGLLELDRAFTDREQWAIYRETGQYARMAWIIQGSRGGHQRNFTEWQKLGLARRGLRDDPPYPGELPFAPFDNRVLDQLHRLQQSQAWNDVSARAERSWHLLDDEEKAQAQEARRALADWAEDQLGEVLDSATRAERAEVREFYPSGVGRPDHLVDADEALSAYIEGDE